MTINLTKTGPIEQRWGFPKDEFIFYRRGAKNAKFTQSSPRKLCFLCSLR